MIFANRWHRNYVIRRYLYGPCLKVATRAIYQARHLLPASWSKLDRPIFVVGVSRSGTTVFVDHFARHPDVCDWSEAAQILDLDFYNPAGDTYKDAHDVTPFDAFRIRVLFGTKTRFLGKRRFVNKHPENSLRLRYLRAIFPDAFVVHLIRNGRAAVESNYRITMTSPFRRSWPFGQFPKPIEWRRYQTLPRLDQFAHQWVDIIEHVRSTAEELDLSPDRYLEIRYEDLCRDPAAVLRKVDEFCGLDPTRRPAGSTFRDHNDRWHSALAPDELARVDAIIGRLNAKLGY